MRATPSTMRRVIPAEHTVGFGDDVSVTFSYDRNKITDAWLKQWTELEKTQDANAINAVLADLIYAWDVVNDDGTDYPVTEEHISYLFTLADKGRIVEELLTASIPTRAEGNASLTPTVTQPSISTPPPVTPPNGTPPLPSPPLSTSPSPT